MRLAEQHKRLTEKTPNSRGYLNFDRETLTRNIGGETPIADKLRFFMLIYSQQTGRKEKRSQKSYLSSCLLLVFGVTAFCNPQPSVIAAGIPGVQLLSQTIESDINILYVSSIGGSDTGATAAIELPSKP